MLYMDYAATSPMLPEVIDAMSEVMKTHYGNPSSLHRLGVEAEMLVRRARETIAASLRCRPGEIRFTSGGTESNNWALRGTAYRLRHRGRHMVTGATEHASVYETCRNLEAEGFEVTYVPADETGCVRLDRLKEALRDDTILVSVMHVNNETGRVQPVEAIGALLRDRPRTLFHVDAVQAIGKLKVDPRAWGADLLSGAAHKVGGPKGAGFLYCREGAEPQPLLYGGGQEQGLRAGTENVPAIVGMAKAIRMAAEAQPAYEADVRLLRRYLADEVRRIPELRLTGTDDEAGMAPHIVHFTYPGMKSEVLVHALEQHGVCVSAQSACSSGASKPSRVLEAMGFEPGRASAGIRISFSSRETLREMERLCEALNRTVEGVKLTAGAATTQTERRARR